MKLHFLIIFEKLFDLACSQECGSRLTEPVGFIQSPNYPSPYPNNYQCSWIIGAGPTDTVTISAEGFNVEPAQGCLFDYVELQTSTFTERYCGRTSRNFGENRSGQLTTSGSVQILFQSDAGDAYLGFRLRYEISSGESVGCESEPCKNGAECLDLGGGEVICFCADGFSGDFCETGADPCASSPCQNGCVALGVADDDLECQCIPGFVGPFCETNEDNCRINLCENGGQCIDRLNNFDCVCPAGFTGPRCQTMRDPCQPNPCRNGGACESRALEFTCFCLGWQGLLCDQPLAATSFEDDSSQSLSFSNETSKNEFNEMNSVVIYGAAGGGGFVLLAAAGVAAYFFKKKKTSSKNWVQPVNTLPKRTRIEDIEAAETSVAETSVNSSELNRGVNLLTAKKTGSMPRSTIDFGQFSEHL